MVKSFIQVIIFIISAALTLKWGYHALRTVAVLRSGDKDRTHAKKAVRYFIITAIYILGITLISRVFNLGLE